MPKTTTTGWLAEETAAITQALATTGDFAERSDAAFESRDVLLSAYQRIKRGLLQSAERKTLLSVMGWSAVAVTCVVGAMVLPYASAGLAIGLWAGAGVSFVAAFGNAALGNYLFEKREERLTSELTGADTRVKAALYQLSQEASELSEPLGHKFNRRVLNGDIAVETAKEPALMRKLCPL